MRKLFFAILLYLIIGNLNAQVRRVGELCEGGVVFEVAADGLSGYVLEQKQLAYNGFFEMDSIIADKRNHTVAAQKYNNWEAPSSVQCQTIYNLMNYKFTREDTLSNRLPFITNLYLNTYKAQVWTRDGVRGYYEKRAFSFSDGITTNLDGRYYNFGIICVRRFVSKTPKKHFVGELLEGGVVIKTYENDYKGLIVEINPNMKQSTFTNASNVINDPSNHSTDGKLYKDWRLPTKDELELILKLTRANKIPKVFFAKRVDESYYWTSTLCDQKVYPNHAFFMDLYRANPLFDFDRINSGYFYIVNVRNFDFTY